MKNKIIRIMIIIFIVCISYINYYRTAINLVFTSKVNKSENVVLKSIKYHVLTESCSESQGKFEKHQDVYFVYPYKLRIDTVSEGKTIEIYNNEKHYYYDDVTNKIRVKQAFPQNEPYVVEIVKKVMDVVNSGRYEFFGYEEKNNLKIEVLGIKNNIDQNNYMHKIWISQINGILLPIKEEYFINGQVVEKSEYIYEIVNENIEKEIFEIDSLPKVEIVDDGYLAKHFETIQEARKYLNFKEQLPLNYAPTYISVSPPDSNPCLTVVYIVNNKRIILSEWVGKMNFNPNAKMGNIDVLIIENSSVVFIKWVKDNIVYEICGEKQSFGDIIRIAEEITKAKFILQGE
jgi:outer membrane lipoprotein-sorting protein